MSIDNINNSSSKINYFIQYFSYIFIIDSHFNIWMIELAKFLIRAKYSIIIFLVSSSMSSSSEEITRIMESLPCRLDRFWKARILRKHESEQQLCENLKLCICEHNGEQSE